MNTNEPKPARVVGAKHRSPRDDVALRKVARAVLAISKRQVLQRRVRPAVEPATTTKQPGADHVQP